MTLRLKITKKGANDKSLSNMIDKNDWVQLVESDKTFIWFENINLSQKSTILPKKCAEWTDPTDYKNKLVFDYFEGTFSFQYRLYSTEYVDEPFDKCLTKMLEVARKLNAKLQTYDGFDIDESFINGEVTLPEDEDNE